MMKVGVVNCGSSSIKYEVFGLPDLVMVASGIVEKIGSPEGCLRQLRRSKDGTFDEQIYSKRLADHQDGFDFMVHMNRENQIISDDKELFGIGHRVVHGGELFRKPTLIDDSVVAAINSLIPLAPLHNPSNLLGIEIALTRFPNIPQVAVFDTAFHQTLPPHAFTYAVPYTWYTRHSVRRYGFHGTSHRYVSRKATRYLGKETENTNLITLHLGNGASCTALRGGVSIDTSMGLTPLEGLVMGTRSGDIDPALHFYIIRETGMSNSEIENALNSHSGLKGICGLNDMREIEEEAGRGEKLALLALDVFCYRIKKYIGAYWAVLGRLDAVIFTGGIGENSATVRSRVCHGLEHAGIILDEGRNATISGAVAEIQRDGAPVKLIVVKTDEEQEIARQTISVIEKDREERPRAP
ncbi:acetate kinase [Syntrophus gentianae]|uniref:Acetate kinase n=1 Tax=Syntrophus gentianae TaxID=43775 RepID=A0A1H7VZQ2_9BACT|nr:acetate kinase [Syntrophus gentianae]SEM14267.1 acetate kinase [Syntrophus gentianae]